MKPGPRNLITDVPGFQVGNAEDMSLLTGCTVILPDQPAFAAVDLRGGGPGTRETELLSPDTSIEKIDALVLSGGSAFGLETASGVQAWLAARNRGFKIGSACVPIVPSAVLFDLLTEKKQLQPDNMPFKALGNRACDNAGPDFKLGNSGAGLGAQAGSLKGGLGSCSLFDSATGWHIGALAAVNSAGSVVMEDGKSFWAWPFELNGEFGNQPPPTKRSAPAPAFFKKDHLRAHTTLAVVATDAPFRQNQLRRIAIMAQDGLARAIRPVHSPLDGDIVFALSSATGTSATGNPDHAPGLDALARAGALAADCLARAVARGIYEACALGGLPAYRK